jgi:hypothetical protein
MSVYVLVCMGLWILRDNFISKGIAARVSKVGAGRVGEDLRIQYISLSNLNSIQCMFNMLSDMNSFV